MVVSSAPGRSVAAATLTGAAVVAVVATVGGDARWVAALGAVIANRHDVIARIPFATAPTAGWHNPFALAELIFHGLYALDGDRGLALAQMAAVATAFLVLGTDARRAGASDSSAALALLCLLVGAFSAFAVVRLQLFSIVLFALLLMFLRSEHRHASRRIWLLVPLLAVWSNLHGGVLIGLVLALIYLALDRRNVSGTRFTLAVGACCVAGCFLNSAFLGTPAYFAHLFRNELAVRHAGLWRNFSFGQPSDVALLAVAVLLLAAGWRSTRPRWEVVATVVLAIAAVDAPRGGIWLLAVLVAPAAAALSLRPLRLLWATVTAAAIAVTVAACIDWPRAPGHDVVAAALATAHGRPVLAEGALSEQVAAQGGRIWVGDPLDAFSRADQRVYVAWLEGERAGDAALRHSDVIVVRPDSPAAGRVARAAGAQLVLSSSGALLYVLRR